MVFYQSKRNSNLKGKRKRRKDVIITIIIIVLIFVTVVVVIIIIKWHTIQMITEYLHCQYLRKIRRQVTNTSLGSAQDLALAYLMGE